MKIIKRIDEGDKIPFGWGFVRITIEYADGIEVMPIPLNYIMKAWYWTVRTTKLTKFDKELAKAKDNGWRAGYQSGRASFNEHQDYMVQAWMRLLKPIVKKNKTKKIK